MIVLNLLLERNGNLSGVFFLFFNLFWRIDRACSFVEVRWKESEIVRFVKWLCIVRIVFIARCDTRIWRKKVIRNICFNI